MSYTPMAVNKVVDCKTNHKHALKCVDFWHHHACTYSRVIGVLNSQGLQGRFKDLLDSFVMTCR